MTTREEEKAVHAMCAELINTHAAAGYPNVTRASPGLAFNSNGVTHLCAGLMRMIRLFSQDRLKRIVATAECIKFDQVKRCGRSKP